MQEYETTVFENYVADISVDGKEVRKTKYFFSFYFKTSQPFYLLKYQNMRCNYSLMYYYNFYFIINKETRLNAE
jgi:hypothetical protein